MEEILHDLDQIYDGSMMYINNRMNDVLFEYNDMLYNEHYVVESKRESLMVTIKRFFTNLIISIKDYIRELSIKIDYTIREKHIRKNLEELREEIIKTKDMGKRFIDMPDYWNYRDTYLELNEKLSIYANRISRMMYKKAWEAEEDLEKFNIIIEEYTDIMIEASDKKIRVNTLKALDFVENELKGKSEVLSTLNESMELFEQMYRQAKMLETKINILGQDIVPKHVNLLMQVANGISAFVRKHATRFIMGVTFLFAI